MSKKSLIKNKFLTPIGVLLVFAVAGVAGYHWFAADLGSKVRTEDKKGEFRVKIRDKHDDVLGQPEKLQQSDFEKRVVHAGRIVKSDTHGEGDSVEKENLVMVPSDEGRRRFSERQTKKSLPQSYTAVRSREMSWKAKY